MQLSRYIGVHWISKAQNNMNIATPFNFWTVGQNSQTCEIGFLEIFNKKRRKCNLATLVRSHRYQVEDSVFRGWQNVTDFWRIRLENSKTPCWQLVIIFSRSSMVVAIHTTWFAIKRDWNWKAERKVWRKVDFSKQHECSVHDWFHKWKKWTFNSQLDHSSKVWNIEVQKQISYFYTSIRSRKPRNSSE